MPYCPRCSKKLTKNKVKKTYSCKYHGFVRNVYRNKDTVCTMTDLEYFKQKQERK